MTTSKIVIADKGKSLGLPISFGSCINESVYDDFVSQYEKHAIDDDIVVSITTNGGQATYALAIANVLSLHKGKVTVQVPLRAMSGGTIIALAGTELQLGRCAILGPIDPQMCGWPLVSMVDALDDKKESTGWLRLFTNLASTPLKTKLNSYHDKLDTILARRYQEHEASEITTFFMEKYSHDTPIHREELPSCIVVKDLTEEETTEEDAQPTCSYIGGGMYNPKIDPNDFCCTPPLTHTPPYYTSPLTSPYYTRHLTFEKIALVCLIGLQLVQLL